MANRKVPKVEPGVNDTNYGVTMRGCFLGEGIIGLDAKDVAKECDTLGRSSWVKAKGECGSEVEPAYIDARLASGCLKEIAGPGR